MWIVGVSPCLVHGRLTHSSEEPEPPAPGRSDISICLLTITLLHRRERHNTNPHISALLGLATGLLQVIMQSRAGKLC